MQDTLGERHSCLETFGELSEHNNTCLGAMVNPHIYSEIKVSRWNWDTKTPAHGLKSSLQSFGVVVVGFRVLKISLDYLKGLRRRKAAGFIYRY